MIPPIKQPAQLRFTFLISLIVALVAVTVVPQVALAVAPEAPVLTGEADTGTTLNWNTVTGATSYKVYKDDVFTEQPTETTTFFDAGDCEPHVYKVKATNADGDSPDSNAITLTQSGCEPPPPEPVTTGITERDVHLFALALSLLVAWQVVNAFRYRSYD